MLFSPNLDIPDDFEKYKPTDPLRFLALPKSQAEIATDYDCKKYVNQSIWKKEFKM